MRLGRAAIFVLALGMGLNACQEQQQAQQTAGRPPQAVPESEKLADFTLPTLAGESVNLRRFEGEKVVVVNFWATWCGPCRREIPDFNEVYASYRDRGVEFLGISLDDDPRAAVPAFMAHVPISYPVLVGSPEIAMRYNVNGIPHTIIIDRSGRVAYNVVGMLSADRLRKALDQALHHSSTL